MGYAADSWTGDFETRPAPMLGGMATKRAGAGSEVDAATVKTLAATLSVNPKAAATVILQKAPGLLADLLDLAASTAEKQNQAVAASMLRERASAAREAHTMTAEQESFVALTNKTMRAGLNHQAAARRPYRDAATGFYIKPLQTPTQARAEAARRGGK